MKLTKTNVLDINTWIKQAGWTRIADSFIYIKDNEQADITKLLFKYRKYLK